MSRNAIGIGLVLLLFFASCKDKMICPAFQSTYILDDSVRWNRFNPIGPDSLPKGNAMVRKSKYGIIEARTYRQKMNDWRTIPMQNVLPPPAEPDSTDSEMDDLLAMDPSLSGDSTLMAQNDSLLAELPPEEVYRFWYRRDDKFNVDQEYYNKEFGEKFLIKEEDLKKPDSEEDKKEGGFFKNLFKRKEGKADASVEVQTEGEIQGGNREDDEQEADDSGVDDPGADDPAVDETDQDDN